MNYKTKSEDAWQILRIQGEFTKGFDTFNQLGPCISVFGSARTKNDDRYYKLTEEFSSKIVDKGFGVITGGGPGIMEAANKGCKQAKGQSIGIGIELPFEAGMNEYVDLGVECRYFFTRKVMFLKYSKAFVVFPGGLGTLDEFFESVTLAQCGHNIKYPIVLVGSDYWTGLVDWLKEKVCKEGRMSESDFNLFKIVDSADDIVNEILDYHKNNGSSETNF
jgi:uncharacterized protein (TIGR00730 family)